MEPSSLIHHLGLTGACAEQLLVPTQEGKIEMGVARKPSFNPSAPTGLSSSFLHPALLVHSGQGNGSRVWAPGSSASSGLSCELPGNAVPGSTSDLLMRSE